MAKLMIQVLGNGMIPRGYGLAPRKEPFSAPDIHLINLILNTRGLTVNYVNPENNQLLPITNKNLKQLWDRYSQWTPGVKPASKDLTCDQQGVDMSPSSVICPPKDVQVEQPGDITKVEMPAVNTGIDEESDDAGIAKDDSEKIDVQVEQPAVQSSQGGNKQYNKNNKNRH